MHGRAFLIPARSNSRAGAEPYWRDAVVGPYYALFLECRDALVRWGRPMPPKNTVHHSVRSEFLFAGDGDLKSIGSTLGRLGTARNEAHYNLQPSLRFASSAHAQDMIK